MEIQKLPPWSGGRAETGSMQFGDDWPGVFIRGDNALAYANMLDGIIENEDILAAVHWPELGMLSSLRDLLRSCSVGDTGWPPKIEEDGNAL